MLFHELLFFLKAETIFINKGGLVVNTIKVKDDSGRSKLKSYYKECVEEIVPIGNGEVVVVLL